MPFVWNRDLTECFIDVFKKQPSLWDIRDPSYQERKQKESAIKKIAEQMVKHDRSITTQTIRLKINSIRSQYRKQLKALGASQSRGDDKKPSLWCFYRLDFLRPVMDISYSQSDLENHVPETAAPSHHTTDESSDESEPVRKHLKKSRYPADKLLLLAAKRLKEEPDKFKMMADIWATKLRQMNSSQQLYAEKCINEILIDGILGNLSSNSFVLFSDDDTEAATKDSNNFEQNSTEKLQRIVLISQIKATRCKQKTALAQERAALAQERAAIAQERAALAQEE